MITNIEKLHILVIKLSNVLSKFTILCWATFIAILGHMQPTGCRLDTPGLDSCDFMGIFTLLTQSLLFPATSSCGVVIE